MMVVCFPLPSILITYKIVERLAYLATASIMKKERFIALTNGSPVESVFYLLKLVGKVCLYFPSLFLYNKNSYKASLLSHTINDEERKVYSID